MTRFTLKYNFSQNAIPAPTAPGCTGPLLLKMYLVSTTRSDSPKAYWYQRANSDATDNFDTRVGGQAKITAKVNTQEIRILGSKTVKVGGRTNGYDPMCAHASGQFTVKMNKKIKYTVAVGDVNPYPAVAVRPNVWFCFYLTDPDANATSTSTDGSFFGQYTINYTD